jgi:protein-S-isoprenylcysteine O-methyltransferase Ste14
MATDNTTTSNPMSAAEKRGALIFGLGLGLFGWAMVSNAYFSTTVRIQDDRGHAVASAGPYRYVRHPGYDGWIVMSFATPLMLGSWWALIPGTLSALLMVVRTALEDKTLQAEFHLDILIFSDIITDKFTIQTCL